jgi:polyferredoxin
MSRVYVKRPIQHEAEIRQLVQLAFLLLNIWIGIRFYQWVRHFETGGDAPYVSRPPGVEGWLPIASLMNLKILVLTGAVPTVHPSGLFLLVAFLATSVVFRKSFCSWLCPIGTISEWLWKGGVSIFGRAFVIPRWLDIPLRSLKYILLSLFIWVVVSMPVPALREFLESPYGLVADVKMLDFFRHAGALTLQVCAVLVLLSVVTRNFWCRYLCPYGALMGLASLLSPVRITRDPISCIDCGKCAKACPSMIPVDVLTMVRTPECNGCLSCVSVCPVKDALEMRPLRSKRRLTAVQIAGGVWVIFLTAVLVAKATGHWHSGIDETIFYDLLPKASQLSHPR